MKIKIILLGGILLLPKLLFAQTTNKYANEGTNYPTRTNFFEGIPEEKNSKIAFKDEKNLSNDLIFNYDYSQLTDYMVAVPGLNQTSNTTNPKGIKLKSNATLPATFTNNNAITITDKGFTIAFWTKWPYSSGTLTADILKILNENSNTIYGSGITYDRRVFVNRQIHRTRNTEGLAPFWNLKFWNPENADIDKSVAESQNGLEWFFVMIVQEKTQVRLHIGMPDGAFDCMYLNYGLEDQAAFNTAQTRKLSFFGNDEEVYLQDLSIWDLPLCREEAFEYYKDSRGILGSTFGLNNSLVKNTVIADDNTRMINDAQRAGGCITTSNNTAAKTNVSFIKETKEEEVLKKESLSEVILFPNPARSEINIKFPNDIIKKNNKSPITINLYDLQGRVLRTSKLNLNLNTINWKIPQAENLPNGIYYLKLNISGEIFSRKIAINCGCR